MLDYLERYLEEYPLMVGEVVGEVLKVVSLKGGQEFRHRRLQVLKMVIGNSAMSEEIIDTIGNLYIDLVSSETGKTPKEVIVELLGEDDKLVRQAWDSDDEEQKMGEEIDEYVARQKALEVLRNKNKQTQQQKLANSKTNKKSKKSSKSSKFAESFLIITSYEEALNLVNEELKVRL